MAITNLIGQDGPTMGQRLADFWSANIAPPDPGAMQPSLEPTPNPGDLSMAGQQNGLSMQALQLLKNYTG